uniref:Uncharacterized protein n=1 Tax=Arundo donax TaxID=35708 RepID=A0A0A9A0I1_ARUDO
MVIAYPARKQFFFSVLLEVKEQYEQNKSD